MIFSGLDLPSYFLEKKRKFQGSISSQSLFSVFVREDRYCSAAGLPIHHVRDSQEPGGNGLPPLCKLPQSLNCPWGMMALLRRQYNNRVTRPVGQYVRTNNSAYESFCGVALFMCEYVGVVHVCFTCNGERTLKPEMLNQRKLNVTSQLNNLNTCNFLAWLF